MATLTDMQVARIHKLRYEDGLTRSATRRRTGHSLKTIQKYAPGRPGKVPVAPVRKIFLASELTAAEVARRLGWYERGRTSGDSNRVKRTLGINDDVSKGKRFRRKLIDAETAGLIAEAYGRARWEIEPDEAVAA